ncbi:short-chain dehydrogenase [Xylogone sp. PMI_703]|nr:short-chain dehydrogenase [Xylogone sp. PMI_703]
MVVTTLTKLGFTKSLRLSARTNLSFKQKLTYPNKRFYSKMVAYGFDTRGEEIVAAFSNEVKNKTFAITGPSEGGIGGQIAIDLARGLPGRLILFGRSIEKIQPVIDSIKTVAEQSPPIVNFIPVDLNSLSSVREAAQKVISDPDIRQIDGIVNNAGIMSLPKYETSEDGFERQLAVNHLSHFLLTNLLMPKLLLAPSPRVINLSSYGHRMSPFRFHDPLWSNGASYDRLYAYAQTKTANILFSVGLNNKLGPKHHLLSYAVDPGSVTTKLARHMDEEAFKGGLEYFARHGIARPERKVPEQGGAGALRALLQPDIAQEAGIYLTDTQLTTDPEIIKPYATDDVQAERLWELSEKLVGETFSY